MSKASVLKENDQIYSAKKKILAELEVKTCETLQAKTILENRKLAAMLLPQWEELHNDKSRDAYLKAVCAEQYTALDKAQEAERKARFDLTMVDLQMEHLKIIVKVNCEWQQEPKLK